ncbi:aromatic alcohol reductase [Aspergillus thermomutatus]|uniref:NmrA-like domain-containing protein n=1 Tax=Aspergillus thermomutatus TaxID=41047 RepID=A0A397G973_ASPTH|nr:uncharacterized protein CDV56_103938 [Aspergillus thermomutatus]RHZ45936.1 hypothetical protein CDV56_103938 [Aspergillus thermomutatus]
MASSITIKNVALAGATGNVGSRVLTALVDLGFNVTVLNRSAKAPQTAVTEKVIDFSSMESISAAVKGQDAVIDTTNSDDIETSLRLIAAAAANGVYRFITSDFGLDPDLPGVHEMPVFGRKKAFYDAVKKSTESGMTYTVIACGPFLDWCLASGFAGIILKDKIATIFDDGANIVPWTTLEDVGKATAGALLKPNETRNRPVYVHSVYMSQMQLLNMAKEVLGDGGWRTTYQDMKPLFDQSMEDLRSGNITPMTFGVQIQYCIATPALAHPWKRDDNGLVGVKERTPEEVKELISSLAPR